MGFHLQAIFDGVKTYVAYDSVVTMNQKKEIMLKPLKYLSLNAFGFLMNINPHTFITYLVIRFYRLVIIFTILNVVN